MFSNIDTSRNRNFVIQHYQSIHDTGSWRVCKLIFLENEALNEKAVTLLFDVFLHVESPSDRSYHGFGKTLYMYYDGYL